MNARTPLFLVSLALTIGACAQRANGPSLSAPAPGVPFAGTSLVLDAHLSRDFMPILPPQHLDGRPLLAVLRVRRSDGGPLPSGLLLDGALVTFGNEIWLSQPETVPTTDPALLMGRSPNGPKWGPGVTADVAVTVKQGNQSVVLRAPAVPIERTD